ncbi:MAG TPA: FAD-dependent oxidoreductase, partial [Candidatus Babeliales bacterium]|nr:FAD-dependent oxidoreductase [Candidatus Babeliales bacterium]
MAKQKTKVLIVGGGFAGIKTALEISNDQSFDISLLSNEEEFRYYPALYISATGGRLLASSVPLAEIFKDKPVNLIEDTAQKIDRDKKTILSKSGKKYSYDILVLALGVVTNYFGIKGLKEYSYGIKTQAEAMELRDHIHKL